MSVVLTIFSQAQQRPPRGPVKIFSNFVAMQYAPTVAYDDSYSLNFAVQKTVVNKILADGNSAKHRPTDFILNSQNEVRADVLCQFCIL